MYVSLQQTHQFFIVSVFIRVQIFRTTQMVGLNATQTDSPC